jgi:hypothetical protein
MSSRDDEDFGLYKSALQPLSGLIDRWAESTFSTKPERKCITLMKGGLWATIELSLLHDDGVLQVDAKCDPSSPDSEIKSLKSAVEKVLAQRIGGEKIAVKEGQYHHQLLLKKGRNSRYFIECSWKEDVDGGGSKHLCLTAKMHLPCEKCNKFISV